jgi:hypothetical protein
MTWHQDVCGDLDVAVGLTCSACSVVCQVAA